MRLLGIPQDIENAVVVNPLDQILYRENALESAGHRLDRLDDSVELLDTQDSPLKLLGSQALLADFEL